MAITNVIKGNYRERKFKRKHKDAFRNIKIWVSDEEWKKIRKIAKAEPEKQLTVCDTVENLIIDAFTEKYLEFFPVPEYSQDGRFVNTWLTANDHSKLHDLAIDWGLSIRRAAYKILNYKLDRIKLVGGESDGSSKDDILL